MSATFLFTRLSIKLKEMELKHSVMHLMSSTNKPNLFDQKTQTQSQKEEVFVCTLMSSKLSFYTNKKKTRYSKLFLTSALKFNPPRDSNGISHFHSMILVNIFYLLNIFFRIQFNFILLLFFLTLSNG